MTVTAQGRDLLERMDRLPGWPLPRFDFAVLGIAYFFVFYDISDIGFAMPARLHRGLEHHRRPVGLAGSADGFRDVAGDQRRGFPRLCAGDRPAQLVRLAVRDRHGRGCGAEFGVDVCG